MQARVSECSLSTFRSPIPELQHAPLPLKVLWTRERAPTLPFSVAFYLDSHLRPSRSWECVRRATGNTDTQDSPHPRLGGNYHFTPYNILYGWPRSPHPNGFLSRESQMGVPKLPNLGFSRLWSPITLQANLRSKCGFKQSCNSCQGLFNGMSRTFWRQVNRVDSWIFVVGSQIGNLIPGPSFGHNLCFRCPNEQCKPNFDIYVRRAFQWYKERQKPLHLAPKIALSKVLGVHLGLQLPPWEFTWSVTVDSFTLFALPGTCDLTPESPTWPATL